MKSILTTTLIVTTGLAFAGETVPVVTTADDANSHINHSSPLDHAPAGIMAEHIHAQGEWMVGYHYMHMEMEGHRQGTNELSTQDVFDLGFTGAAENMTMDMHMLEVMYAPTEWLTLMLMGGYVYKDMDMTVMAGAHGHDAHGGHGGGHMASGTMQHSHSSEGFSDTSLTALFPIVNNGEGASIIGALGVSAPTADVDVKENGVFLPYGMQLGSGTWDLLPSVTGVENFDRFQMGSQIGAVIRLEEEGDSGFSRGERYFVHTWLGYELTDWLGVNTTLSASTEGDLEGHYDGGHNHSAPQHFQGNYGGDIVDAGVGLNLLTPDSWGAIMGNQRVGVRATTPIYQDLNGVGMNNEWSLFVSWQKAF